MAFDVYTWLAQHLPRVEDKAESGLAEENRVKAQKAALVQQQHQLADRLALAREAETRQGTGRIAAVAATQEQEALLASATAAAVNWLTFNDPAPTAEKMMLSIRWQTPDPMFGDIGGRSAGGNFPLMPSLLNGLSALGAGVSTFAGNAAWSCRRRSLRTRPPSWPTSSPRRGKRRCRGSKQQFQTGLQGQQQQFQAGQTEKTIAAEAARTAATEAGATARNTATLAAEKERDAACWKPAHPRRTRGAGLYWRSGAGDTRIPERCPRLGIGEEWDIARSVRVEPVTRRQFRVSAAGHWKYERSPFGHIDYSGQPHFAAIGCGRGIRH